MRRHVLMTLVCLTLAAPAVAASQEASWAQREIQVVTTRGLMGGASTPFQPEAPLTQAALADSSPASPSGKALRRQRRRHR